MVFFPFLAGQYVQPGVKLSPIPLHIALEPLQVRPSEEIDQLKENSRYIQCSL